MPDAELDLRPRLWWTALLVLIALSGAGLAVAADRHHAESRPELFWAADLKYGPGIDSAWAQVRAANGALAGVASAGRAALGTLQALDLEAANRHIDTGELSSQALIDTLVRVAADGGLLFAAVDRWRLSPGRQAQLSAIESALAAAGAVPADWPLIAATGRTMSSALQAMLVHDGLVFRATTAGRQAEWDAALELLGQAEAELAEATTASEALAERGNVETLTDLLGRYAAYDAALRDLYMYVRDSGRQEGDDFERLSAAVDAAQAALPGSDDVLSVVVAESAAPALAAALVRIEQARGEVIEALTVAPEPAPSP